MTEHFTVNDLHRIRALVERAARAVGITIDRTDALVLAVNEVAANAIVHAGGWGSLTVEQTPAGVSVEVTDTGPGLPADVPIDLPPSKATGGRGLWMARRLCQLTITTASTGVTVRLFMPIS